MRLFTRSTHAGKLERWLGASRVEKLSQSMKNWYGPPIALAGTPGKVYAVGGGDFKGPINGGSFSSLLDHASSRLRRAARRQLVSSNAGFSSLSDLIYKAEHGGKRVLLFHKTSPTAPASGGSATYWFQATLPPAGGAAAAAPGGTVPDNTTTGGMNFDNTGNTDQIHFCGGGACHTGTALDGSLLLYDRLFAVTKTMSSTGTEAVTGVPTRYTSQTNTAQDYIGGNFLFIETRSALSNTAHNWTVCTYTNQNGNASTLPSIAGVASASSTAGWLDMPTFNWFCPLATGDVGVKALTQMQCDASVTGAIDFVVGHPIAWMPMMGDPKMLYMMDGIVSAFNMTRIFDGACLALLEVCKSSAAATPSGRIITVRG